MHKFEKQCNIDWAEQITRNEQIKTEHKHFWTETTDENNVTMT